MHVHHLIIMHNVLHAKIIIIFIMHNAIIILLDVLNILMAIFVHNARQIIY
jgi:hypothetical protein